MEIPRTVYLVIRSQLKGTTIFLTSIAAYLSREEAIRHCELATKAPLDICGFRRGELIEPKGGWKKYSSPYDVRLQVNDRKQIPEYEIHPITLVAHVDQYMEQNTPTKAPTKAAPSTVAAPTTMDEEEDLEVESPDDS